nr:hypothetical protein [Acidobacteriota bacterium]
HIAMVIPKRVAIGSLFGFVSKFLKGCIMAVLFQMVNNSAANDAVNVAEDFRRLQSAVRDHM